VEGSGSTKLLIIIKPRQMLAEELSGEVGYTNNSLLLPITRSVTTSSDPPPETSSCVIVCAENHEIDC